MKIGQQVMYSIDAARRGEFDAALLHACIAIDTTAKKIAGMNRSTRTQYIKCLRAYYWLLEPMIGAGINLEETRFENLQLDHGAPDFADFIYEVFRCGSVHGGEIPPEYAVIPTIGPNGGAWTLAKGELHMPDRVIWALLSVAVFARVNADETSVGDYYLTLGTERFPLVEWWGGEDRLRPIADAYNKVRVKLEGLDKILPINDPNELVQPGALEDVTIINPSRPSGWLRRKFGRALIDIGRKLHEEKSG